MCSSRSPGKLEETPGTHVDVLSLTRSTHLDTAADQVHPPMATALPDVQWAPHPAGKCTQPTWPQSCLDPNRIEHLQIRSMEATWLKSATGLKPPASTNNILTWADLGVRSVSFHGCSIRLRSRESEGWTPLSYFSRRFCGVSRCTVLGFFWGGGTQ